MIETITQPPQSVIVRGNMLSLVDALVEGGFLGYENREEFVTTAVRTQIGEYLRVFPEAKQLFQDWLASQKEFSE